MGELVHEQGNLAAFFGQVLAYRGVRGVLRPADHGDILNLDKLRSLQLLELEDCLIGPFGAAERHTVVAIDSTSSPRAAIRPHPGWPDRLRFYSTICGLLAASLSSG
jgi:hypothetical protein